MSVNLIKPTVEAVKDPGQLASILLALYTEALERRKAQLPDAIPNLKAITLSTFADARRTRGDANGNLGPRACIVTCKATLGDGGQRVFAWNATSTAPDDDSNTLVVVGVNPGRWVKIF